MHERATNLLTAHHEKLLYLVVGGWNVLFQYGVFSLCWYLLSPLWPPIPILLIAYLIASVNGFLGFGSIGLEEAQEGLMVVCVHAAAGETSPGVHRASRQVVPWRL